MKHSAYRSMKLAKEGKTEKRDGNLRRWIDEDWRNLTPYAEGLVNSIADTEECGKRHKKQKGKSVCRPMKKVNKDTPKTADNYSKEEIKKAVEIKNKGKMIKWDELKGSGIFDTINRLRVNPYGLGYYNYCGPGTKFEGQEPVDAVDYACQDHDADYVRFRKMVRGTDLKNKVRQADNTLIEKADKAKINNWIGNTARLTVKNAILAKTKAEDYGLMSYDNQIGGDPNDTVEKVYSNIAKRKNKFTLKGGSMSYALGDDDIREILPDAKIMDYDSLDKYQRIEDLLTKDKDYVIVLYESDENSGHWVCILRYDDTVEFFCSYGSKIDEPLNWINEEKNIELGQNDRALGKMFNKTAFDIVYNKFKFQKEDPNIATCGRWCIMRILKMKEGMNLQEFIDWVKTTKPKNMTYDEFADSYIQIDEN